MSDHEKQHIEIEADTPPRKRKRRWAKRIGWVLALLLLPVVLAAAFLSTSIGKRFVTDQIAQVAPASGLRFEVGRIDGDIYGQATLHDVVLSDPQGEFLTVPEVELNWNPLAWLTSGLDIRELAARRGTLIRLPELLPGDPDAPILPDFDIRVDRLGIENLTLAPGLAGEEAQRVDLEARADIRSGRVFLEADGTLGREDVVALLLDAMPDGDRFDLALDYNAPAGGVMAQLIGLEQGYRAQIGGDGTWTEWLGHALVQTTSKGDEAANRVAGFQITNRAGEYAILGQIALPLAGDTLLARAAGGAVSLAASGGLEESVFDGRVTAVTDALFSRGEGAVDLAGNRFDNFEIESVLRQPDLFGDGIALSDTRLEARLDGAFRDLEVGHTLRVGELDLSGTLLGGMVQTGVARFNGNAWVLPLDTRVQRVTSGIEAIDPSLQNGVLRGMLSLADGRLDSDSLRLIFPRAAADLTLRGNLANGAYALAGPVTARSLPLQDIGTANGTAKILLKLSNEVPWSLRANFAGGVSDLSNETIANVAGGPVSLRGGMSIGGNSPLSFTDLEAESEKLILAVDGRVADGRTSLAGSGRHTDYGPFTVDAELASDGPRAALVFADPLPAAGLKDVRVALAPNSEGFDIGVAGGSTLGSFEGALDLFLPADAPARIDIASLRVWRTDVSGRLALEDSGVRGQLALSGGGLQGDIALVPQPSGQGFDADLAMRNASFGGATPIAIANADIDASGAFGNGTSRIEADISGAGLEYGGLFVGRFAAKADVVDGRGDVTASVAGRRSDRFALKFDGDLAPDRIALLARGEFAGREIDMPRRAVLTQQAEGEGWRLAPTHIGFGRGYAIVEGALGGRETAIEAQLANMPLSLADLAVADLGFGGTISGLVEYRQLDNAPPSGSAKIKIENFTRSGLVLSSQPIDVLTVLDLTPAALTGGVALRDNGTRIGLVEGRITGLAPTGDLAHRLMSGRLAATMRYDGDATALWRVAGIETFDFAGPIVIRANATRTLNEPRIEGRLASDDLRVQSAISGTDIADVSVRGSFAGSRLRISRFAGTAASGGTVRGSGTVDLAGLRQGRGPQIDLKAAVDRARLLNANGLSATLTGPLRIVSNGVGGTIAGRVRIDRASWRLGVAAEDMALPDIKTREVNRPVDSVQPTARGSAWRYLVDASGPSRIDVDGMGLNSEWGADIVLRGTTDDPRIGGEARLVRGDYTFAGTRFELTRGRIDFDENVPIDPRLDIEAETSRDSVNVTVSIGGNAQSPEIAFSSTPSLPEEEILARLLFGGSITTLSATDALQLGAALASLRGGGGLDPVTQLRSAIGLDQLRIVSADPALNRGTGVALGKNIGRRFYVEIVTDGRGYSATQVEYRITRWLALLGSVSTIGRESVVAEVSRDY